ncbi:hypothetical protein [Mesorhizobium sp.]|uniref:hypothetical protein n=1 Tax=Mesorhizobium sp. TaxID=1871066 RepID=UPI000FE5A825|nr:hypothetical protein [Mesorhizobium sp.]RWJ01234.1 MAG: hypothetical protein EOR23_25345 [Mesorhizobium sp.]TIP90201.1 MAG: hypothetical protein E5X58_24690 [Mesorhizobium sp.]TIP96600.1 MAG: hypothetical protein E5X60_19965 [Mesorhizobium sp.]
MAVPTHCEPLEENAVRVPVIALVQAVIRRFGTVRRKASCGCAASTTRVFVCIGIVIPRLEECIQTRTLRDGDPLRDHIIHTRFQLSAGTQWQD